MKGVLNRTDNAPKSIIKSVSYERISCKTPKIKTVVWKYETSDWIVWPDSHSQRLNRRT